MCCFSVADVFLEDPPPEKKKEEKKEEKVNKNYLLVSDQLNLQPIVSYSHFSLLYLVILTSYFDFFSLIPTSSTAPFSSSTTTSANQLSLSLHLLHFPLGFNMSKHFTYNPDGSMTPHQPPAAKNPWTSLPAHHPSTQQSNAWNPWTNPPPPSRNMSHHYTYQPVRDAAQNPWTSPQAPVYSTSPSSSCYSNHAVHSPSFAVSVKIYYQPSPRKLWTHAHPSCFLFDGFASIVLRICYHRLRFSRKS